MAHSAYNGICIGQDSHRTAVKCILTVDIFHHFTTTDHPNVSLSKNGYPLPCVLSSKYGLMPAASLTISLRQLQTRPKRLLLLCLLLGTAQASQLSSHVCHIELFLLPAHTQRVLAIIYQMAAAALPRLLGSLSTGCLACLLLLLLWREQICSY
jgi:hypothetical protein